MNAFCLNKHSSSILILLFTSNMIICNHALASGFRITENSIAGIATSNALVADNINTGALAYNPAAMSFHKEGNIVAGLTYATFNLSVIPAGGTKTDNIGKDSFLLPNLYIMDHINHNWTWGLAINTPFGLETKWPDNTFPAFGGNNALEPALTKLEVINYNPNIAWRLDDNLSVAFGLDYYDVRKANLNSQSTIIEGSGQHHGWNIAFLHDMGDLDFGFSYHSPVSVHIDGTLGVTAVTSSIELPSTMQFGLRYHINDKLAVEIDLDRTGWSSMKSIVIRSKNSGRLLTSSTHNWKDANAWRLGVSYDFNSNTQLRFGYSLDETPQKGDALYSARTPDTDRQTFSIGIAQTISGWTIEAGYMFVILDDHTEYSNTGYTPGPGAEPNGTSAYNGSYEAEGHMLGLGINKKF